MRTVLFLGGNGHAETRLEPARTALRERGSDLVLADAAYPGFDGRARVDSLDEFLASVASAAERTEPDLVYATGIGGLFALALRARGVLIGTPVVLQGAVLWGLEHRAFARWMKGPLPKLLALALRTRLARRRFRAKHLADVDPSLDEAFFRGYERCSAFADFFRWLRPPLLRALERDLPAVPGALDDLEAWWGERDHVVGLEELELSEAALGRRFPRRVFPDWGHYPMLERPAEWSEALDRVVA